MITLKDLYHLPPWEWPEDMEDILINAINDTALDPSDRLRAVEMAGDMVVINDSMARALLALAGDANEADAVRETAVIGLGPVLEHADMFEFEDPDDIVISETVFREVQKKLQHIHEDESVPKDVRRKALEAAVRAPLAWHHKAVETAGAADDEDWRLTAVFCMRFIKGFEPQILDALESSNLQIKYQAVLAAGVWGVQGAWPHIAGLLDPDSGEDESLLLAAIEASSGLERPEAITMLERLLDSENENIIDTVHETLAMMGSGLPGEVGENW